MSDKLNIVLLEPFSTGSHATWANNLIRFSSHEFHPLTLPGRHWKWRMQGGAISLARQCREKLSELRPDLILGTDMLDLTTFLGLSRPWSDSVPTALYFHENQPGYPRSPRDPDRATSRDLHYSFINYTSALAADRLIFNSDYNLESMLMGLGEILGKLPDHTHPETLAEIRRKSRVICPGLDLTTLRREKSAASPGKGPPLILWNHRMEYDKGPEDFFQAMLALDRRGYEFQIALPSPAARDKDVGNSLLEGSELRHLKRRVIHQGRLPLKDYIRLLWRADLLPVTAWQEFFGLAVAEAIYCGVHPLLPHRLVYPGLYDAKRHPEFFYDSPEDLVEKLAGCIESIQTIRTTPRTELIQITESFDWPRVILAFDREFETIAAGAE